MWTHHLTAHTQVASHLLWPVLVDGNGWAALDENIAAISCPGPVQPGAEFWLQPKGGPKLHFRIGQLQAPTKDNRACRYSEICQLFLAEMETVHALRPSTAGTEITVTTTIRGSLSWLWSRLVETKHAAGLPAQTARIVAAAVRS